MVLVIHGETSNRHGRIVPPIRVRVKIRVRVSNRVSDRVRRAKIIDA